MTYDICIKSFYVVSKYIEAYIYGLKYDDDEKTIHGGHIDCCL